MKQNSEYLKELDLLDVARNLANHRKRIVTLAMYISLFTSIFILLTSKELYDGSLWKKQYLGITKIYVSKSVTDSTATALQEYFTGNELLTNVIDDLDLNTSTSELESMIDLNKSSNTILQIEVKGTDKELTQKITNSISTLGNERIKNKFSISTSFILEPAYTNELKPPYISLINSVLKFAIAGFVLGLMVIGLCYSLFYTWKNT